MQEINFYIDESGDEGINKGSDYFILTAIAVKKSDDLKFSKIVDLIKEDLEIKKTSQLHWKTIKGKTNKKTVLKFISSIDIKIINIIVDTKKIVYIKPKDIYYYYFGYLMERICKNVVECNSKANIYISSRGNLSCNKLKNYIYDAKHQFQIDQSIINEMKIFDNFKKRFLQIADCCCSSLGQYLKYKDAVHYEYIKIIKPLYLTNNKGIIKGNGIKLVPSNFILDEYIKKLF